MKKLRQDLLNEGLTQQQTNKVLKVMKNRYDNVLDDFQNIIRNLPDSFLPILSSIKTHIKNKLDDDIT